MSFAVVVHVRGQRRVHRVALDASTPVRIGRGWDNDVIVDDEYLDPSHLRLSVAPDGSIRLTDLDTRNGSRAGRRRVRDEVEYTPGTPVAIGDSTVTLHDTETAVAPAQRLDSAHVASRLFGSVPWAVAATLVAAAATAGSMRYLRATEATGEALAEELMGLGVIALIWSLAAGVVGKLFRHRMFVALHWTLVCVMVAGAFVLTALVDVLRFNLDSNLARAVLVHGSTSLLIVLFAYSTLSLCTRLGRVRKAAGAAVLAVLPIAFALLTPLLAEEHERWTPVASVDRIHQPPALLFRQPVSLETHFDRADALFATLDAQVEADAPAPVDVGVPAGDVQFSSVDDARE